MYPGTMGYISSQRIGQELLRASWELRWVCFNRKIRWKKSIQPPMKNRQNPCNKIREWFGDVSTREIFVLVGSPKELYLLSGKYLACQLLVPNWKRRLFFCVVSVFRLDDKYVCMVLWDIKPLFRQRLGRWVRHAEDAQSLGSLGVSSYSMPKVQMSKINSLRLLVAAIKRWGTSSFGSLTKLFWKQLLLTISAFDFLHVDTIRLCL